MKEPSQTEHISCKACTFCVLFLFLCIFPLIADDRDFRVLMYNGKPTPESVIEIYAHRAGRGLAPENTLYACQSALKLGVDYLDFDVGMTKDGVLVVTHDIALNPEITRDAEGQFISQKIPIYTLTYQQLKGYNVGSIKQGSKYASFFPMQVQLKHAQIPSLKEAILYTQSIGGEKVGFQIEIKRGYKQQKITSSPQVFANALYALLKDTNILRQTEVQAFDFHVLFALQKLDSSIKTTYLTFSKSRYRFGNPEKAFNNSIPAMIKAFGGSCWGPFEMDLTKDSLDEAHQLELKVIPWGFPEKEGMEFNHTQILKLIEWGVDGIITDRPDELRGILAAKGYNLPKGFYVKS